MEDKSIKRRSWIKNIAIVFLLILLLLTFFSNTILNYSLPEVAVQYAMSGNITSRIRGTGTIEASQSYDVKIKETRTIKDIGIKVGSRVEIGDTLFLLEEGESPDLTSDRERLESLKRQYQLSLLKLPADYSADLLDINRAEEDLAKLKAKVNAVKADGVTEDSLKNSITESERRISYLNQQIAIITKQLSSNESADNSYIYSQTKLDALKTELAQSEYIAADLRSLMYAAENKHEDTTSLVEKLTEQYDDLKAQYDDLKAKAGSTLDDDNPLKEKYRTLEDMYRAHETLKKNNERTIADRYKILQEAYTRYINAQGDEIEAAKLAYESESTAYNRAVEDGKRAIENSEIEISRYLADLRELELKYLATSEYRHELAAVSDRMEAVLSQKTFAEREKTAAEKEENKARENYEAANDKVCLINIELTNREIRDEQDKLDNLKDRLSSLQSIKSDEEMILSKERELETKKNNYAIKRKEGNLNLEKENIELQASLDEIRKLEKEIEEKQQNSSEAEIVSPVSGVVSSLNYKIGSEVPMNQVYAVIQLIDYGYSASFNVTADQARRLRVGDAATIMYYWGASDVTAFIESIKIEGTGQAQTRTVTLNITGDVTIGSTMTFALGERSQNYDTVVPKSAIREDNNGKFILIVEAKNTPLGNRYTASRVDVEVLAEDDTSVAISGGFYGYEFVITTSSVPITSGMQVRLKDK